MLLVCSNDPVKVVNVGMCAVCWVLNGLEGPQFSFWVFTQAEPHCQCKPGRWGQFCFDISFLLDPSIIWALNMSPGCLIWLNGPEQWRLENYCCEVQFSGQWKELWRDNPFCYMRLRLSKNKQVFFGDFYTTYQLPCHAVAAEPLLDDHSQRSETFSLSLDCCSGPTIQQWFPDVITVYAVFVCYWLCLGLVWPVFSWWPSSQTPSSQIKFFTKL